jgi:ParB-like chromosome segregation protein Spo0J
MWPLDRVRPYENNPRNNDTAVDAVAASIKEFGFSQPIVVDSDSRRTSVKDASQGSPACE